MQSDGPMDPVVSELAKLEASEGALLRGEQVVSKRWNGLRFDQLLQDVKPSVIIGRAEGELMERTRSYLDVRPILDTHLALTVPVVTWLPPLVLELRSDGARTLVTAHQSFGRWPLAGLVLIVGAAAAAFWLLGLDAAWTVLGQAFGIAASLAGGGLQFLYSKVSTELTEYMVRVVGPPAIPAEIPAQAEPADEPQPSDQAQPADEPQPETPEARPESAARGARARLPLRG